MCLISLWAVSAHATDTIKSSGTGFAVTADGWLVTNAHVVDGCERVEVVGGGAVIDRKVDVANDIALVKIGGSRSISPLAFRRGPIRLGEDVVAAGFPLADVLSDSVKITTGVVSALAGLSNDARFVQLSAPIQPGNSGGPVVDREGFVLGITTATFSKRAADEMGINAQNINFAIRSSVAELLLQSHGITIQFGDQDGAGAVLSTADLAEKISPSVFKLVCYGSINLVADRSDGGGSAEPGLPNSKDGLVDAAGYDAIGFDYATLKDVDYDRCRSSCLNDGRCRAITYNKRYRFCFLKNDVVALIRNDDASAAYTSSKSSEVIVSDFTTYSNADSPGGDYLHLRNSTYLQCFVACVGDKTCRAFAYVSKKGDCWLKDRLGVVQPKKGVELGRK